MKPPPFHYERPATLGEALSLLGQTETEPMALAGGQSLMPMMNFRMSHPGVLVDLNRIEALRGIRVEDERVRIGAMTRYAEVSALPALQAHIPLLARALPHIAHAAIRNRGTIGGSLALADPAAETPAVALALGATLHVAGANGERDIAADEFFLGLYESALEEGELITAVSFPRARPGERFAFHEIARRHGDYAMAGVAVADRAGALRIVFFGIADRPMRATAAEATLSAAPGDIDGAVEALGRLPFAGDLNAGAETKQHLAGVALRRAWKELAP